MRRLVGAFVAALAVVCLTRLLGSLAHLARAEQRTARVELGGGLRWGTDDPDATEKCTSTPTTGECSAGDLQPISGGNSAGWFWDVVAPGNGTYTFKGEITKTLDTDPDVSNNASQITIVVNESTGAVEAVADRSRPLQAPSGSCRRGRRRGRRWSHRSA